MAAKPLVFVTRLIPEPGISLLKGRKDVRVVRYPEDRVIPRSTLLRGVKGATAILAMLTDKIDRAVMDAAGPQLRIIANYAVGFDNVDLAEAGRRGITVTNTPDVLTDAVAEHAFALLMATCRRVVEADKFTRAGKYKAFSPTLLLGAQLKGKTLGVIGLGRIGEGVAERAARGMGMKVVYSDVAAHADFEQRYAAKFLPIDELLAEADVVSIHVPLLPSTKHLINAKRLAMMKRTAYLINTSRGPVVDEKALVSALKRGRIAGAGLDVFEFEPKFAPGLTKLPNVVLTPHIASATHEARSAMAELAARSIIDVLDGRTPAHVVK
jgi:glyoxylate reductase